MNNEKLVRQVVADYFGTTLETAEQNKRDLVPIEDAVLATVEALARPAQSGERGQWRGPRSNKPTQC